MSCKEVITYYHLCGHNVRGIKHVSPCSEIVRERHLHQCWNPLPLKPERYYLVAFCFECATQDENRIVGVPAAIRDHDCGSSLVILNPGKHEGREAVKLSRIARREVEHYETPTSRNKAAEARFQQTQVENHRKAEWMAAAHAWLDEQDVAHHDRGQDQEVPVHTLPINNWDGQAGEPALLIPAWGPFEQDSQDCSICLGPLLAPRAEYLAADKQQRINMSVRVLPCASKHLFHFGCLQQHFDQFPNPHLGVDSLKRMCPLCRTPFRILYTPSFGDPKYNFKAGPWKYVQVDGYVEFNPVPRSRMLAIAVGERYDRWGEMLWNLT